MNYRNTKIITDANNRINIPRNINNNIGNRIDFIENINNNRIIHYNNNHRLYKNNGQNNNIKKEEII